MAHPHAGGENKPISDNMSLMKGSSPRGRGKPGGPLGGAGGRRLIPARAGKTSRARVWCWGSRDHPRAGGENWAARRATCPSLGSSPRGRGKLDALARVGAGDGLIPARAGKTVGLRYAFRSAQAHPRAGGENRRPPPFHRGKSGSSPRGRGKRLDRAEHRTDPGLIPARAGKTHRVGMRARASRAHPRAGGENDAVDHSEGLDEGSSPRGRGKRRRRSRSDVDSRLIPARAGKTS